ncbi:MAG: flagellar basal body-associated FliL family protein [Phycisphaerae bacterium]|jgi:flagellar basal body-associated protein FliL|nr:flagellar basal body-associated FliL family protein [Phycisphaerae bacterium]
MPEEVSTNELSVAPANKNKKVLMIGLIAGIPILLGVGIFLGVKILGKGPADAVALAIPDPAVQPEDEHADNDTVELRISNIECPHTNTGRLFVIRMTVYATVPQKLVGADSSDQASGGHGDKKSDSAAQPGVEKEIENRMATIKDRMRTIIAGADPSTLCLARSEKPDYGLSTLRRQFKTVLDEVLGKGKVKDVMISDYMYNPID